MKKKIALMGDLRATIDEALAHGAVDTALFLAERLHAAQHNEASQLLVAECLLRGGQPRCAYEMLQGCTAPANRFLLARCCVELRLWAEAEGALGGQGVWDASRVLGGAYGLALLGSVYQALLQRERAVLAYRAALAVQPLLWAAVRGLCELGVEEDPSQDLAAAAVAEPAAFTSVDAPTSPFPSTPLQPNFFSPPAAPRTVAAAAASSSSSADWAQRMAPLARALWLLRQYRCREAVEAIRAHADEAQRCSGWAHTLVATALAELGEYADSVAEFERARAAAPWRLEGAEVHSTALWHLKRDVQLSHLAHECLRLSKEAPQTWCAVGNVMSLLREHDAALRFFVRAQKLCPEFVYAFTLCGHEHVANDDLEQASAQFRLALQRDPRHYKAWYGLGMVYYRTQRFQLAEYHFVQALRIHPQSSALHMYRGMVKYKVRDYDAAQECLQRALACNPHNVLAKSLLCQVLVACGQLDRGAELVEAMLEEAPREAFLHFLKGSISAKRGERALAVAHFTVALDLDSRNGPLIKSRIDSIQSGANALLASVEDEAELEHDPENEFEVIF